MHPAQPTDYLDLWGDADPDQGDCCRKCVHYARPEQIGRLGHCVRVEPGRDGPHGPHLPYPQVPPNQRACGKFKPLTPTPT